MSFVKTSNDTCICIFPKVASLSIWESIGSTQYATISGEDALKLPNRIAFYRDPIERVNSMFNHLHGIYGVYNGTTDIIPDGTIIAYADRVDGFRGENSHHWKQEHEDDLQARIQEFRGVNPSITNEQIKAEFIKEDYERFIDYILSDSPDNDHWRPQTAMSKDRGTFVPNIVYNFEQINEKWGDHFPGKLPQTNSWQNVPKQPYRLGELQSYYADDTARRN